jgi:sugar-specific transcriptional regulator TrmB
MKVDENLLVNDLQVLGLTQNEAKVLITLIKLGGDTDAPKIAKLTKVPRTKIYQVLEGLIEKNIVMTTKTTKTNLYRLISTPDQIISDLERKLTNPINEAVKRTSSSIIDLASTIKDQSEGIHQVWLIKEKTHVSQILEQVIENSKNEIITNAYPLFLETILPFLAKAKERGVELKLIMLDEELEELPEQYKHEFRENVTGISYDQLNMFTSIIPSELEDIFHLFQDLLLNRPNVLVIDPETPKANVFLYIQSQTKVDDITAIQVQNRDFVDFATTLITIIFRFASAIKALQAQFILEE